MTMYNKEKENAVNRLKSFVIRHKRGIKLFIFILFAGGMVFKGLMQQPRINENNIKIAKYQEKIKYEETRQEEIDALKEKVNTDEYIERMASEKLGLVKKNAKIFVDISEGNGN